MLGQQEQSGLFLQLSRIIKGINFYKSNTLFNIVSGHQEDNHRSYLLIATIFSCVNLSYFVVS